VKMFMNYELHNLNDCDDVTVQKVNGVYILTSVFMAGEYDSKTIIQIQSVQVVYICN
jgi:hydrogenase-4 membrane subunit HyfE